MVGEAKVDDEYSNCDSNRQTGASLSKMEKFNHSVSLLTWAFNEEDSIVEFLERATELMEQTVDDYEIVLIDDASTDNTYKLAKEFQKRNPQLVIFQNKTNLNVGLSSQRAIKSATKEYLFWRMVDWCYDISYLREHLEHLKSFDIVQGVRRKPVKIKLKLLKPVAGLLKLFHINHITKRSDTISKAFISVINYVMLRVLFGVPLSDFQNITFYSTKWIQSIEYEAKGPLSNPEGLFKSYWQGKRIKEVEIDFIARKEGEAKGTKTMTVFKSVMDLFRMWFKWIILNKRILTKVGTVDRTFKD
jgi:glycosyltransferase involved in cell wall biosynthesis